MDNYLRIKDWALEDRPREKLLAKGTSSLSDAELIAILIGSGSRNETAVELSKRILSSVSYNLNELGKMSIQDLMTFKGIGEAKAITIVAAMELGRRRKLSEIIEKRQINSSKDAYELFVSNLGDLQHEEFWVLYLNRSNRIIHQMKLSQGGISGTVIDVKIALKFAIEKLANGIILCHNHPSGNLTPSRSDIEITKKFHEASNFMEISLLDHLIVCDKGYYSFADEGMLNKH
jgi:DNA repair protein RadC